MATITHLSLRVESPFAIDKIMAFSMYSRMDTHAEAILKMQLLENTGVKDLKKALMKQVVSISCDVGSIYSGIVDNVRFSTEDGYDIIEMALISGSVLLDYEKKSRSFQDVHMTYQDVITKVLQDTKGSVALIPEAIASQEIGYPIIQYLETDWDFMRRLASHHRTSLFPELSRGEAKLWVGKPENNSSHVVESAEYTAVMDKRFYSQGGSQKGYQRKDFFHVDIYWYENFAIGDNVRFQDMDYVVCAKACELHEDELRFTYTLATDSFFLYNSFYNRQIAGMSLLGTVLETRSETVKVHLDIDTEQNVSTAYPYHWVPATGNIMYLMPKVGTRVSLYFPSEDEASARLTCCVRTNGGLDVVNTSMTDFENRQLLTEHGKQMYLYPLESGFASLSEDGKTIEVVEDDLKGILFKSHNLVGIKAIGNISLDAKNIQLKAKTEIQSRKAYLRLESDAEIATRLTPLLESIEHGSIPTNAGLSLLAKEEAPKVIVEKTSTLLMVGDGGRYIYHAAPYNYYVGLIYTPYPVYIDYPREQELDTEQIWKNGGIALFAGVSLSTIVGAIVGSIAGPGGTLGGAAGGAKIGLQIGLVASVPVAGIVMYSDYSRGGVSEVSVYIAAVVEAVVIAWLSYGIEVGAMKAILRSPNAGLHFLGTSAGAFLSGIGTDALTQYIHNGNVNLKRMFSVGFFSFALSSLSWGWRYGVRGKPIPYTPADPIDQRALTSQRTDKGIEYTYTNQSGNQLEWTDQISSKNINNNIDSAVQSTKVGTQVEGKVGQFVRDEVGDEVIRFSTKVNNVTAGMPASDIDVEAIQYIIEAKASAGAVNLDQLDRLTNPLNPDYFNYMNKPVILYVDAPMTNLNPTQTMKMTEAAQYNVYIANGLEELESIIKHITR